MCKSFFFWYAEKSSDNFTNVGGGSYEWCLVEKIVNTKKVLLIEKYRENHSFPILKIRCKQYHVAKTKSIAFVGYQENPLFSVLYDFIAQGKPIWSVSCSIGSDHE